MSAGSTFYMLEGVLTNRLCLDWDLLGGSALDTPIVIAMHMPALETS